MLAVRLPEKLEESLLELAKSTTRKTSNLRILPHLPF